MYFIPAVRSLIQTVWLLIFGLEAQLSYFRQRKCLYMDSKLLFHQYAYFTQCVYCFLRIFPPVYLFQTVCLFQSLGYTTYLYIYFLKSCDFQWFFAPKCKNCQNWAKTLQQTSNIAKTCKFLLMAKNEASRQ